MSIDARIIGLTVALDGVFLNLEPREPYGHAGQQRMEILNPPDPPTLLEMLIGECVWGSANQLMLGNTKFADRVGYTQLQLSGSRQGVHAHE